MAKDQTDTANVETPAPATNPDGTPATPATEVKAKNVNKLPLVAMSVPQNMKDVLDKIASERGTTVAALARDELAKLFGITLPPMTRKSRSNIVYATPEARKEAVAKAQRERTNKASALLKAFEAGAISGDLADILARFAPTPRAKSEAIDTSTETPVAAPVAAE